MPMQEITISTRLAGGNGMFQAVRFEVGLGLGPWELLTWDIRLSGTRRHSSTPYLRIGTCCVRLTPNASGENQPYSDVANGSDPPGITEGDWYIRLRAANRPYWNTRRALRLDLQPWEYASESGSDLGICFLFGY